MRTPDTCRGRAAALWLLAALLLLAGAAHAAPPGKGPTLGVVVRDVPFPRLQRLGLDYGVAIRAVVPDSPADDAGLQPGDIITALDDDPVYSPQRLQWLVSEQPAGEPVTLSIHRGGEDGERTEVNVVPKAIGARPDVEPPAQDAPAGGRMAWLGIRMQPLTGPLRRHFGVPAGEGILIAEVEPGSPADQAGIAAGDVLLRIDRRTVRSPNDVYRALIFFDPGETIEVAIVRAGETKTLQTTLGRKQGPERSPYRRPWDFPLPHYRMDPRTGDWPSNVREFLDMWRPPGRPPQGEPERSPETSGQGVSL